MGKKKPSKKTDDVITAEGAAAKEEAPAPRKVISGTGKTKQRPLRRQRGVTNLMNIATFARTTGTKLDKLAGFAFWCKRRGIEKLTADQWRATLAEFKATPVAK